MQTKLMEARIGGNMNMKLLAMLVEYGGVFVKSRMCSRMLILVICGLMALMDTQ